VRFCSESISGELVFYNVTSPTRPVPPEISSHHHWLIISHLSLSPLFLSNQAAVKQLILDLDIYSKQDLPKRKHLVRKLDGIKAITVEQADLVEQGRIIRGLKMVLQLDPSQFKRESEMYHFGQLLANFFPFCISDNNILQVSVQNSQTGEIWLLPQTYGDRGQI